MEKYTLDEGISALDRVKLLISYKESMTLRENIDVIEEQGTGSTLKNVTAGATAGAATGALMGGVGAVPGALVGGLIGLVSTFIGTQKQDDAKRLFEGCKRIKTTPTLNIKTLDQLSDELNTAISGVGTDEEAIKSIFMNIPTVPDLCALIKAYEIHGDLFNDLDGDLDGDDEWKNYVIVPLRNAVRKSDEITKEQKNTDNESWPDCVKNFKDMGVNGAGKEYKIGPNDGYHYFKDFTVYNPKTKLMNEYTC